MKKGVRRMKFKKFTVRDSTYEYAFDDGCIVLKVGKRIMYIDPVILPKLNKLANRLNKISIARG